jgi:hypothetical protein
MIPALAAQAGDAPAIPIAPLSMGTPLKPDKIAELDADGVMRDKANGQPLIKIVKNEIQTNDGQWILRLGADGTVTTRMKEVDKEDGVVKKEKFTEHVVGKINAKDELTLLKGGKIWFDEKNGTITSDDPKGLPPFKFHGVNAKNRRTALLWFVSTLAPATATTETHGPH